MVRIIETFVIPLPLVQLLMGTHGQFWQLTADMLFKLRRINNGMYLIASKVDGNTYKNVFNLQGEEKEGNFIVTSHSEFKSIIINYPWAIDTNCIPRGCYPATTRDSLSITVGNVAWATPPDK